MKASMTVALLLVPGCLAFTASAQAKFAPVEPQLITTALDNAAIDTGLSSAMREANYFNAPQPPLFAGRVFPCRLQMRVFDKTRLATRSCN